MGQEKGARLNWGTFFIIAAFVGLIFLSYFVVLIATGWNIRIWELFLVDHEVWGRCALYLGALVAIFTALWPSIDKRFLPLSLGILTGEKLGIVVSGYEKRKIHLGLTIINQRLSDVVVGKIGVRLISPSGLLYELEWKQFIVTVGDVARPTDDSATSPIIVRGREAVQKQLEFESYKLIDSEAGLWHMEVICRVNNVDNLKTVTTFFMTEGTILEFAFASEKRTAQVVSVKLEQKTTAL